MIDQNAIIIHFLLKGMTLQCQKKNNGYHGRKRIFNIVFVILLFDSLFSPHGLFSPRRREIGIRTDRQRTTGGPESSLMKAKIY